MKENKLITEPIPKLIGQIAIPASVGFFFNTMYNVVDTYYGGMISTEALAAMSLSFPIFFLILAMGSGISNGATALITNSLGEKEKEKAEKYGCQAISFAIIFSIFLTILGLFAAPSLFKILGANSDYLKMTLSYTNIIFYGTIFFLLTNVLNGILIAEGDTKTFRNLIIIGFLLNLLLDPWFMFGWFGFPKMGLAGVALATILIHFIEFLLLLRKVITEKDFKHIHLKNLIPNKKYYIDIIKQGFPASLSMMSVAIGVFVITYFVSAFGKDSVAAYGIATRMEQIAILPAIGLNIAVLTLSGQNNGAKRYDRLKEIFKKGLRYGIIVTIVGALFVFSFSRQLMMFFTKDQNVINIGTTYLRISVLFYITYTILNICISILQGIKKPLYGIYVGLYRQILMPITIFYVLTNIFKLQIKSIWWAIFFINWSAAIFTFLYTKNKLHKLEKIQL
ncbi:MAG: MATE family efflux transporter [Patescibacteria group bacterium]|nr:MATE family efflux transporter [Patescibacteria group bacterium]MDD4304180.1 MATE family efflux transporter [Patescibacteria group bacterium]MDD4695212.1 MATE family efflux transporter [Patescibacteria group bacterium]